MKLTLSDLKTLIAIITALGGAWLWIDGRYAHAEDAQKSHTEIQKTMIVNELRQIDAKKLEEGKIPDWEKLRYNDLQIQLKELMNEKK